MYRLQKVEKVWHFATLEGVGLAPGFRPASSTLGAENAGLKPGATKLTNTAPLGLRIPGRREGGSELP
jgi:hypothetical protein